MGVFLRPPSVHPHLWSLRFAGRPPQNWLMRSVPHPLHEFVRGWFVQRGRATVERAVNTLREQGVPDELVTEALQQVDTVLRQAGKDRLLVGDPQITVCSDEAPYVSVRFVVDLPAAAVVDLSWRLTERIVERRLDHPALVIGFTTAEQASAREIA